jgi:hypothetical protein
MVSSISVMISPDSRRGWLTPHVVRKRWLLDVLVLAGGVIVFEHVLAALAGVVVVHALTSIRAAWHRADAGRPGLAADAEIVALGAATLFAVLLAGR